ncbi:MAG: hypothetical protein ACXIVE_11620, partial [Salinarimonas sp.]
MLFPSRLMAAEPISDNAKHARGRNALSGVDLQPQGPVGVSHFGSATKSNPLVTGGGGESQGLAR